MQRSGSDWWSDLNLLDLSSQAENSPFPSTHTPNERWSIETVLTVWRFMINIPSALLYTTQIKWKSVMSIKMSSSYACTLESIDHMHVIEEMGILFDVLTSQIYFLPIIILSLSYHFQSLVILVVIAIAIGYCILRCGGAAVGSSLAS